MAIISSNYKVGDEAERKITQSRYHWWKEMEEESSPEASQSQRGFEGSKRRGSPMTPGAGGGGRGAMGGPGGLCSPTTGRCVRLRGSSLRPC